MCLVHSCATGFLDNKIAALLLFRIWKGPLRGNPRSLSSWASQVAWRAASKDAMYSASAVDSAVVGCCLDFQATVPPNVWKR